MKMHSSDTIAAVATPRGAGAIAVIRLSGTGALAVADLVFRGKGSLREAPAQTLHHGKVVNAAGDQVDEVVAGIFRAPHSYTGEDVVEFSCHGGPYVTDAVLAIVLAAGARQAAPGEFTRRAFLNGRMDLSRAEAVAALIASSSDRAHRASLEQLNGRLAGAVTGLKDSLKSLCALLEIDLDFSEEGITVISREEIGRKLREVKGQLKKMAETFRAGRLYRDGVSVVIAGPPNAGKSSLFNALLKDARAIVTPVPGTTRDYLEESVTFSGILFRLTDTAGLRSPADPVEQEGILRSRRAVECADVILAVDDLSTHQIPPQDSLGEIQLKEHQAVIIVRNKVDLVSGGRAGVVNSPVNGPTGKEVYLSAATGEGVHALTEELVGFVAGLGGATVDGVQITSDRHWSSIVRSIASLDSGISSLARGATNEFVAFDVRESMAALSEITGEVTSDDVLNSVFSSFCVGK
jgi:tRNA modification GTPase